jgi:uncharacterized protein (DUF2236 family)
MRLNEVLSVGLLPERFRHEYGFHWSSTRARVFRATVRGIRVLRRGVPDVIALWRDARSVTR